MTLYQGVSRLTPDVEVRASPPRQRRDREVAATGRNGPLTLTRRAPSLTMGPANMAGQAWAWAQALKRRWPEFRTEVYTLGRDTPLRFHSDHVVTQKQWKSPGWHVETRRHILRTHTHVLFEGALALLSMPDQRLDIPQDPALLHVDGDLKRACDAQRDCGDKEKPLPVHPPL